APWLVETEQRNELELFCRECFPSIQFPFSGLVTRVEVSTKYKDTINRILNSLYVATTLIYRCPEVAVRLLDQFWYCFRNYGIRDEIQVKPIASRAIHYLLKADCYSETLWPEPSAWEYALSLDDDWTGRKEAGQLWRTLAWEVLSKTLATRFGN